MTEESKVQKEQQDEKIFSKTQNAKSEKSSAKEKRNVADKKFIRASRRLDEIQDIDHPTDTRYVKSVDFVDNPAGHTDLEIDSLANKALENPYENKNTKQKKAAKAKSAKAKAEKEAKAKEASAKHLKEDAKEAKKSKSKAKHAAPGPHASGYKAPVEDPYEALNQKDAEDHKVHPRTIGFQSATEKFTKDEENKKPTKKKVFKAVAIVIGVFLGLGLLSLAAWLNRNVTFTLNGNEETVRAGTPITKIISDKKLSYKHGNLISVSNNVLKEGEGNPFSLKLNGQDLPYDKAKDLCIYGEESVELGDGGNVMEPYDSQVQEQQPTLTMSGQWGSVGFISQWPITGKIQMRTGKISGETAPGDTVEPLKNAIITNKMIEPANGQKLVALTFDDGPSEYTQKYLDILAQYNAHATLFELCNNLDYYPDAARAIIAAGNQIGSHTKTHSQLTKLTPADLQSELSETFAKIKNVTQEDTSIVRPPYGDMSEKVWLDSKGLMSVSVLWTQDSKDWSLPGPSKIVANALAGVQPGSIILMHDGGGNRDQDLQALPQILKTLTDQGYKFVTLKELLASDPTIPQDIASCAATLPDGCTWPSAIGD